MLSSILGIFGNVTGLLKKLSHLFEQRERDNLVRTDERAKAREKQDEKIESAQRAAKSVDVTSVHNDPNNRSRSN